MATFWRLSIRICGRLWILKASTLNDRTYLERYKISTIDKKAIVKIGENEVNKQEGKASPTHKGHQASAYARLYPP
jgi:hypothetical protein